MANKMLIDATHPEETRVVVVRENRVEEFDYESASKKQLRGNIYLAKVTRVEPSLQAAFVNYGGNRHGFLPFNEIHPDYYHLPLSERQALKDEERRASRAAQARHHREERSRSRGHGDKDRAGQNDGAPAAVLDGLPRGGLETGDAGMNPDASASEGENGAVALALEAALPASRYSENLYAPADASADDDDDHGYDDADDEVDVIESGGSAAFKGDDDDDDEDEDDVVEVINDDGEGKPAHARKASAAERAEVGTVESVGSEDALEELPDRVRRRRRNYKIQEVIKRGQILLVQVVKEERGNKGAALTTYLSLAGRYTVLMPNTGSGGGISRKISSPGDRKRLREIAGELDVQEGMGLIIRTAGASRTKSEIKRDYEYLLRLWENVRELTMRSSAPCLVYEEGDLIKRSIRDLYNRDIDEIQVAGEDAYKDAKDFMRMLMPSHAKNVQVYKDPEPIFIRHEVERQLNAMFSPQVTLPSGGYIVLNQTEALVAIDVNSGKSTREFSIEETALKTNLEASDEIARQLRLRDLAGLIVVDFIDMEEKRNNRAVERKLKECLRNDRARIQVGRISHFGLLEMSRQRLRTGMIEGSTTCCPTCQGTGFVRSTESVALSVLRGLEDWLRSNHPCNLNAVTGTEVALYILNHKRGYLRDIEQRYGVMLSVSASERVHGGSFLLEKLSPALAPPPAHNVSMAVRQSDWTEEPGEELEEVAVETISISAETSGETGAEVEAEAGSDGDGRRSRRRRRRRRGRGDAADTPAILNDAVSAPRSAAEDNASDGADAQDEGEDDNDADGAEQSASRADGDDQAGGRRRSRRRGRRGGRHQRARHGREDGLGDDSAGGEDNAGAQAGEVMADARASADAAEVAHGEIASREAETAATETVVVEPAETTPSRIAAADVRVAHASDAPAQAAPAQAAPAQAAPAEAAPAEAAPMKAAPVTMEKAAPSPTPVVVEPAKVEHAAIEPARVEHPAIEAVSAVPAAPVAEAGHRDEASASQEHVEAHPHRAHVNGNGAAHAAAETTSGTETSRGDHGGDAIPVVADQKPSGPRRGWWQRRSV